MIVRLGDRVQVYASGRDGSCWRKGTVDKMEVPIPGGRGVRVRVDNWGWMKVAYTDVKPIA